MNAAKAPGRAPAEKPLTDLKVAAWFLRPYWKQAIVVFAMLLVYSALETISIGALYPFMNSFLGGSGSTQYGGKVLSLLSTISEHVPIRDRMAATSLFLLSLIIASNIFGFLSENVALWYHLKLYEDLQNQVFDRILHNQFRFFGEKKLGELAYIGREAAMAVGEMFFYFPKAGIELFRILAVTALLLSISPPFTLITYGVIALFGVLVYILSIRIVHPAAARSLTARSDLMALFSESVSGIRQIKLFDSYESCLARFYALTAVDRFAQFKSVMSSYAPQYVTISVAAACGLGSVVYVKLYRPEEFALIVPTMIVFLGAIMRLMPAVSKLGNHWMGLKGLGPRLSVTRATLVDTAYLDTDGGQEWPGLSHEIRFDRVSFTYRGRRAALKEISLTIPKDKTIAIVGGSGAGKSTLVDILLRLHEPESGSILLDKTDCSSFTKSSWLSRIGMVSQDTFIFHASIGENIRMGDPAADEERIIAAAKVAHAHDFISEFPEGYETAVGDRGLKLSGGQRQRIAIARAIVRDPEILVLDEATSSLDTISEKIVQEAIRDAKKCRTTIIIAHRLSTIEHADDIFVLHEGRVVEHGSHNDLLRKKGFYHRLYRKQSQSGGDDS